MLVNLSPKSFRPREGRKLQQKKQEKKNLKRRFRPREGRKLQHTELQKVWVIMIRFPSPRGAQVATILLRERQYKKWFPSPRGAQVATARFSIRERTDTIYCALQQLET